MSRRRLVRTVLLVAFLSLPACAAVSGRPTAVHHVVFFELADPAEAGDLIADCRAMVADLPGITDFWAGPALDVGREETRRDFHVGLYLGFTDEQAYGDYLDHPRHTGLVRKWQQRLRDVRIRDVRGVEGGSPRAADVSHSMRPCPQATRSRSC